MLSNKKPDGPDLPSFVKCRNTDDRDTFFSPLSNYRKGHMLHIIVTEKDPFQIVEDQLDRSVGSVPCLGVVRSSGRNDLDLHHGFFKIRKRFLLCRPGNGRVDHGLPVFLHRLCQPFHRWQRFFQYQCHSTVIALTQTIAVRQPFLPCRSGKYLRVIDQRQQLALQPQR